MLAIIIIVVFRFSRRIFVLYLSLVKIYSSTLLILNSPKDTFSFLMNLILVSISLSIITFYRRVLFLEAKECKCLILITSSLTKLIIFLFQITVLTLFISSIKNSNRFIRSPFLPILWELQLIREEEL